MRSSSVRDKDFLVVVDRVTSRWVENSWTLVLVIEALTNMMLETLMLWSITCLHGMRSENKKGNKMWGQLLLEVEWLPGCEVCALGCYLKIHERFFML